ncbi:peptidylprolyl isomerase [Nonlabens xiamenensis]|uniref:peptidylprolyl isomerase n=1 Tax=Nonlabens xiamenensis TaxID=2341043 RepID=UPI000F613142|nr:peptidylprolyl isomerase [Nonlabens xiamenensis]
MKSLYWVLLILLSLSCKDTSREPQPEELNKEEKEKPKTRKEYWEERTYKPQVTRDGDTLLAYIPQDSVPKFFTRYGKKNPETKVLMTTPYGDVTIELFQETPLYRASFIYLVKNEYFNSTYFHRVVKDFVVQGGDSDESYPALMRSSAGNYRLPPNFLPQYRHRYGTVSAAKLWENNPENWHDAFDFFITLNNASHLDNEHTIFGRVVDGMEVIERISQVETDESDWPLKDIEMKMQVID